MLEDKSIMVREKSINKIIAWEGMQWILETEINLIWLDYIERSNEWG